MQKMYRTQKMYFSQKQQLLFEAFVSNVNIYQNPLLKKA